MIPSPYDEPNALSTFSSNYIGKRAYSELEERIKGVHSSRWCRRCFYKLLNVYIPPNQLSSIKHTIKHTHRQITIGHLNHIHLKNHSPDLGVVVVITAHTAIEIWRTAREAHTQWIQLKDFLNSKVIKQIRFTWLWMNSIQCCCWFKQTTTVDVYRNPVLL